MPRSVPRRGASSSHDRGPGAAANPQARAVRRLPSGSLQVTVYAGEDPLTGKRIDLSETVPAGTNAAKEAEKVRGRLLNQVDEQRNPRTSATMNQLMNRYI